MTNKQLNGKIFYIHKGANLRPFIEAEPFYKAQNLIVFTFKNVLRNNKHFFIPK